jgi:hypothetical protein
MTLGIRPEKLQIVDSKFQIEKFDNLKPFPYRFRDLKFEI